jgi:superfamily I DNA/RNA helicase
MPPALTEKQKEVVFEKAGLFVVKACPGSGKTLTVAARLHRLFTEWKHPHAGIAAMSFTNTAWREVESYLANNCGVSVPVGYPHFLGTIDSFLNRFIFLPFGHRVLGCGTRPELTGPPHDDYEPIGRWLYWQHGECNRYSCRLNDFTYDASGQLVNYAPHSHFSNCQSNHSRCTALKATFLSAGYATQADANYFAMKLLKDIPEIARALARRFPVIIVDEAQDSSGIQMRIIECLMQAGVAEVMLAGDPYQAIYEWRQAEPQLFEGKFTEWEGNCVWLSENWRSTQSICDLACRLANSSKPITAKNQEVASYDASPLLYGYGNEAELPGLLAAFRQHCSAKGIDGNEISVLTRSREFVNSIIPGTLPRSGLTPWRNGDVLTRQIVFAKYLFDRDDFRGALMKLEIAAYTHLSGRSAHRRKDVLEYARSVGFAAWRGHLFRLLSDLPESTGTVSAWLRGANAVLSQQGPLKDHTLEIKRDRQPNIYSALTFEDIFSPPVREAEAAIATAGTVHSVKGRSLEAVFLALKSRGAVGRNYVNLLGSDLLREEELRIVYVAATRARKALAIAVPQADIERWRGFLLGPAS